MGLYTHRERDTYTLYTHIIEMQHKEISPTTVEWLKWKDVDAILGDKKSMSRSSEKKTHYGEN